MLRVVIYRKDTFRVKGRDPSIERTNPRMTGKGRFELLVLSVELERRIPTRKSAVTVTQVP